MASITRQGSVAGANSVPCMRSGFHFGSLSLAVSSVLAIWNLHHWRLEHADGSPRARDILSLRTLEVDQREGTT